MKATTKCSFLLIIAFLALTTLAAVPHYGRRDAELPAGAYWQGSKTVVLSPASVDTKDRFAKHEDFDAVDNADNATALVRRAAHDFKSDEWRVEIRTGGPEQHIGTLGKKRLYRIMMDSFRFLGRPYDDQCREGSEFCKDVSPCCHKNMIIPNIVYNGHRDGTYATDAELTIRLWWAEIYDDAHKGLREAVYDLAAQIYVDTVAQEHNCYYVDFTNSRKTRMCNVPRHVLIIVPSNGKDRNIEARFNVMVSYNGKSEEGEYYCEKNLPAYTKYFKENTKDKISKAMNWKSDKIFLFNSCQEDACFDTRERYTLGAPWVEPKGCSPPSNSVL